MRDKQNTKHQQRGFTLIEALITFVIVALGLIGAAMFQSQLIAESGNSKAKMVATKLAETALEQRRTLLERADYNALGAASYAVSSENTAYIVSYSVADVSSVSGAGFSFETHKLVDVTVSWTDPRGDAESVTLSTLQVWSDPAGSLDNSDEAGTGGGNVGAITRPNASAVALARQVLTVAHDASKSVGDYVSLGDDKYGIKTAACTDGGSCVEDEVTTAIKLVNTNSSIMEIRGDIYIHTADGTPEIDTFSEINASPNVLTTEGGGCAVFEKTVGGQIAYTCLFGEGWYGNISLVLTEIANNGSESPADDAVCIGPRSYRYYRINAASLAASSGDYEASIVGQSGLVRFTTDLGNGPFVAASNAAPGLGYYYVDSQLEVDSRTLLESDSANISGNVYNQNFVISDELSNISGSETYYTSLIDDCLNGSGQASDRPLFDDVASTSNSSISSVVNNGVTDALVKDDYAYKGNDLTGYDAEVPNEKVVLGFVNAAYLLYGDVDLAAIAGDFGGGGSTAAESIAPYLDVGMDPLPVLAQKCTLDTSGDGTSIAYSCFVDFGWTGNVEATVDFSGAGPGWGYVVNSPASKAIASGVSASADIGDFSMSCPAVPCQ